MSENYLPNGLPTPSAAPDGLSAPYWEGTRQSKLRIQKCGGCGAWQLIRRLRPVVEAVYLLGGVNRSADHFDGRPYLLR